MEARHLVIDLDNGIRIAPGAGVIRHLDGSIDTLTPAEAQVVTLLASAGGGFITVEAFETRSDGVRAVKDHIRSLRRKIGADAHQYVQSLRGHGYRIARCTIAYVAQLFDL